MILKIEEAVRNPEKASEIESDISFQFDLLRRRMSPGKLQTREEMTAFIQGLRREST